MFPRLPLITIILLICLNYSCKDSKEANLLLNNNHNAIEYLKKSLNDSLEYNTRLNAANTAFKLISNRKTDTISLKILLSKSNIHYNLKQFDSAFYFDQLLSKKAKLISNKKYLGKAHLNLALYYDDVNKSDSAYFHYNQSKVQFEKLSDSIQTSRRLISLGILQNIVGDYFGSKETLVQALEFLNNSKNKNLISLTYSELGSNHRKLSNYRDAIYYYKKAIAITPSKKEKIKYTNNLATSYIDQKEYIKAIAHLEAILHDSNLIKESSQHARILDNLTYAQWLQNPNKNTVNFYTALNIRKKENDKRGLIASHTHLGEYFSINNSKKGKKHLDTVIQLSKKIKNPKAEIDAIKFLMNIYPNKLVYKNRYIHLKDSLYLQELNVKTQFAHIRYNADKANESVLKLEKINVQRKADLATQKIYKIVFIFISVLLIIGASLWNYILLQRQKKEKIRSVYNTEKRISKIVHDELANDIYGVINNLEHAKKIHREGLLNNLENIYNKTRNIAHDNADIQTESFKEELKNLLSQFQNDKTTITVKGINNLVWNNFSDEKKIVLYRVINELLINMKKHSEASLVVFGFEAIKKQTKLTYLDNGKGVFPTIKKGIGLQNVENRIINIGGTFSFDTKPGKGLQISCTFPL